MTGILNADDWEEIEEAYKVLTKSDRLTKIEGNIWVMYKVGSNIIRLDIKK